MNELALIEGLPGAEFARDGLSDLAAGRESIGALLLEIAAPRLREVGLALPSFSSSVEAAEIRLYRLLESQNPQDAYAQYSAWLNRLGRFCTALENRAFLARSSPVPLPQ